MEVKFSAWLSSKQSRRHLLQGALFSGLTRDVPDSIKIYLPKIKPFKGMNNPYKYVTIWTDINPSS